MLNQIESFMTEAKRVAHPAVALVVAPVQLGLIAALETADRILPALKIGERLTLASATTGIFVISWLVGFGTVAVLNRPRHPHSPSPATAE